jgi:hypothetical protein
MAFVWILHLKRRKIAQRPNFGYLQHKIIRDTTVTYRSPAGTITITDKSDWDHVEISIVPDTTESTISMSFHGCPLLEALAPLEQQAGIHIAYSSDLGGKDKYKMRPITLDPHDMPISEFLKEVFQQEPDLIYGYSKTFSRSGQIWIKEAQSKKD